MYPTCMLSMLCKFMFALVSVTVNISQLLWRPSKDAAAVAGSSVHCLTTSSATCQGGGQVCQCQGDFQSTIFWTKQSTSKDHADSTTVLLAHQPLVDWEDHFVRGRRQSHERKSIQHESCTLWFLALHCALALDLLVSPRNGLTFSDIGTKVRSRWKSLFWKATPTRSRSPPSIFSQK